MTVSLVVIFGALALGLVANRSLRPRVVDDDHEGVAPTDLLEPLAVLAVFFIAFVLSTVSTSYSAAEDAAAKEADVVDNFVETSEYLSEPAREALQSSAVCYARAVAGPEWDTMEKSGMSKVPSNWTGTKPHGIRRTFQQLGPDNHLFDKLTAADGERGDARRERVRRAKPSISPYVYGFMLASIATAVGAYAFLIPRSKRMVQIATLTVVTVFLAASLVLVRSLDRPFSGLLRIRPTEMQETARQISGDFEAKYGKNRLPCDDKGRPT